MKKSIKDKLIAEMQKENSNGELILILSSDEYKNLLNTYDAINELGVLSKLLKSKVNTLNTNLNDIESSKDITIIKRIMLKKTLSGYDDIYSKIKEILELIK